MPEVSAKRVLKLTSLKDLREKKHCRLLMQCAYAPRDQTKIGLKELHEKKSRHKASPMFTGSCKQTTKRSGPNMGNIASHVLR